MINTICVMVYDTYSQYTLYNVSVTITNSSTTLNSFANLAALVAANQNTFSSSMVSQAVVLTSSMPTLLSLYNSSTATMDLLYQITSSILSQSANINNFPTSDLHQFFLKATVQCFHSISDPSTGLFNISQVSSM